MEYLIKVSQYFGSFAKECFVDCLCKVSKVLAWFNEVLSFEKFLIYVLPMI